MKNKLIRLIKKPFVRNIVIVSSGTAITQIIAVGSSPVITRLYEPAMIGVLGVFLALSGIIQAVVSLTYEYAIVLPKKDDEAKAIVLLSFMISGIILFFIALIFIFFKNTIVSLLQIDEVAPYVLLIPIFVFFANWADIAELWLTRKEQFKKKATIQVINASVVQATKIGAGFYNPIALILVYISTFGSVLDATMLSWGQFRWSKKWFESIKNAKWFSFSLIKKMARKYYDFPLYRAPQSLLGNFSGKLPTLLLAVFFGPAVVGFYTLGNSAIKAPSNIIAKSFGNVFYPKIAKDFATGQDIRKILIKATTALALVGSLPFGIIIFWGPELFGFVYGEEWLVAGTYARWMSIMAYFGFMGGACWKTIPVIKMQGFELFYTVITTILSAATLYITATFFNDDILTIASFCVLNSILIILKMFRVLMKAKS